MYMYTIGYYLVMVVWYGMVWYGMEAVFEEAGVVCSCDKKNKLIAHFIGSIHRVCVCGYYAT